MQCLRAWGRIVRSGNEKCRSCHKQAVDELMIFWTTNTWFNHVQCSQSCLLNFNLQIQAIAQRLEKVWFPEFFTRSIETWYPAVESELVSYFFALHAFRRVKKWSDKSFMIVLVQSISVLSTSTITQHDLLVAETLPSQICDQFTQFCDERKHKKLGPSFYTKVVVYSIIKLSHEKFQWLHANSRNFRFDINTLIVGKKTEL